MDQGNPIAGPLDIGQHRVVVNMSHEGTDIQNGGFKNKLSLRHLKVIALLADLKLVAHVARALNVTQPAVSKQISELEHIVGLPIVTRERNRLFLTPVGERLAEHARLVLSQIDRAAFDIEAMASGVSGPVQIGVVSSVASILLPSAIRLFKRSAPQSGVAVNEGHFVSLYPMLEAGQIDLLIARIWQPTEIPAIDQSVLFKEPVVVVAGRDHKLAHVDRITWTEAASYPWIMPQANSVARRAVDSMFAQQGLATPTNIVASLSLSLNLELLRQNLMLGLFPQSVAQAHAARGDLVIIPLDTHDLLSEARCFWKTESAETNTTLALFLKCLEQAAGNRKTIPSG